MATKKYDFPQNQGLEARMKAIINGFVQCRGTLRNIKDIVLDTLPEQAKQVIGRQIDDALVAAELASRAISGELED